MLVVASCGPDGHHGRVEGKLQGINQAFVQAYVDDGVGGDRAEIDTVVIKRGKFSYEREVTHPVILTFLYPNFSSTVFVLGPGETVKLKGDASRLSEIEIDGNEDNLLLTEFRKHTLGKRDAEAQREAATFIRSHAKTQAAVVLFREYFANAEIISENPTASLLADLEKAQPEHPVVKQLAQRLRPLLKTAPGCKLPAFTAKDVDGHSVSSADYAGKPVLIVFCSSWDSGFYMMKLHVAELNRKLGQDKLNYLFVLLDKDLEAFRRNNSFEPLPGKVLYDGKVFDSPLVKTLGMRYLSGSLLVGSDGKIKARDIPTEDWNTRIETLL